VTDEWDGRSFPPPESVQDAARAKIRQRLAPITREQSFENRIELERARDMQLVDGRAKAVAWLEDRGWLGIVARAYLERVGPEKLPEELL
jgi:hypothetical protein